MRRLQTPLLYLALLVAALASVVPFYLSTVIAFKPANQVYTTDPWALPDPATLDNFVRVWGDIDLGRLALNTAIVALSVTVGQLVCCTLAGYAFARLEFRGRDTVFWVYLATLMVPTVVTILPLFVIMQQLDLVNTLAALILPTVLGTPYGIFLMRQFFSTLPRELEDAAQLDGAGVLGTIWRIIVPLSRPILATLAVITFVSTWQAYLWPSIVATRDESRVLTVGIAGMAGAHSEPIQLILAASTITLLPLFVIFAVFQRQIVQSIVLSGLK